MEGKKTKHVNKIPAARSSQVNEFAANLFGDLAASSSDSDSDSEESKSAASDSKSSASSDNDSEEEESKSAAATEAKQSEIKREPDMSYSQYVEPCSDSEEEEKEERKVPLPIKNETKPEPILSMAEICRQAVALRNKQIVTKESDAAAAADLAAAAATSDNAEKWYIQKGSETYHLSGYTRRMCNEVHMYIPARICGGEVFEAVDIKRSIPLDAPNFEIRIENLYQRLQAQREKIHKEKPTLYTNTYRRLEGNTVEVKLDGEKSDDYDARMLADFQDLQEIGALTLVAKRTKDGSLSPATLEPRAHHQSSWIAVHICRLLGLTLHGFKNGNTLDCTRANLDCDEKSPQEVVKIVIPVPRKGRKKGPTPDPEIGVSEIGGVSFVIQHKKPAYRCKWSENGNPKKEFFYVNFKDSPFLINQDAAYIEAMQSAEEFMKKKIALSRQPPPPKEWQPGVEIKPLRFNNEPVNKEIVNPLWTPTLHETPEEVARYTDKKGRTLGFYLRGTVHAHAENIWCVRFPGRKAEHTLTRKQALIKLYELNQEHSCSINPTKIVTVREGAQKVTNPSRIRAMILLPPKQGFIPEENRMLLFADNPRTNIALCRIMWQAYVDDRGDIRAINVDPEGKFQTPEEAIINELFWKDGKATEYRPAVGRGNRMNLYKLEYIFMVKEKAIKREERRREKNAKRKHPKKVDELGLPIVEEDLVMAAFKTANDGTTAKALWTQIGHWQESAPEDCILVTPSAPASAPTKGKRKKDDNANKSEEEETTKQTANSQTSKRKRAKPNPIVSVTNLQTVQAAAAADNVAPAIIMHEKEE